MRTRRDVRCDHVHDTTVQREQAERWVNHSAFRKVTYYVLQQEEVEHITIQ